MARILLLGCGQLSSQLPQLNAHGSTAHEYIGIRRSATSVQGVEMFACDLLDTTALRAALKSIGKIDAVVFTATPKQRSEAAYRATYVDIPIAVLRVFHEFGWRPFWLHVSSTGVFSQCRGEYVHENTQPLPQTTLARLLRQSETLIEAYGQGAVLRCGGLYGQGRMHLLNSLKAGRRIQSWPWSYTNRIHREDAVRAMAFLLNRGLSENKETGVSYYHGVDHDPAPLHEVAGYLASVHGLPTPEYFLSAGPEAVVTQNKRVGNRRLIDAGFQFRYSSYRQGFRPD